MGPTPGRPRPCRVRGPRAHMTQNGRGRPINPLDTDNTRCRPSRVKITIPKRLQKLGHLLPREEHRTGFAELRTLGSRPALPLNRPASVSLSGKWGHSICPLLRAAGGFQPAHRPAAEGPSATPSPTGRDGPRSQLAAASRTLRKGRRLPDGLQLFRPRPRPYLKSSLAFAVSGGEHQTCGWTDAGRPPSHKVN